MILKFLKRSILILMVAVSLKCSVQKNPLIIGHRGAKGHIAENTLPSISKAMALGVDGIEIDVFVCKTGELVVFHDKSLDRLTDGVGLIEELTLEEIQKLRVLGKYKIPTLVEVLDLIEAKVFLNIELKGSKTAKPTDELLKKYFQQGDWRPEHIIISSFKWEELQQFRKLNTAVPIAVLINNDPLEALPMAQSLDAIAINPNFKSLNETNTKIIQEAGFKVFPYTINETEDIKKMMQLSVDAIITDYPDRVDQVLSN
ncbi:MAG: glycerophosphodiester phosphodiesterase [Flavobacteriaceae bacterium]|nr:glycerophosphodiester phosphodiesterase [Flavobacteriaceae bacterium]